MEEVMVLSSLHSAFIVCLMAPPGVPGSTSPTAQPQYYRLLLICLKQNKKSKKVSNLKIIIPKSQRLEAENRWVTHKFEVLDKYLQQVWPSAAPCWSGLHINKWLLLHRFQL